jgi:hypothetical protein
MLADGGPSPWESSSRVVALAFGVRSLLKNVHPVVPGVAYWSAQLDPEDLESLIHDDGIRSILNLRLPRPGAGWYDREVATSARTGVPHVDFELSAVRDVSGPQANRLVAADEGTPEAAAHSLPGWSGSQWSCRGLV